MSVIPATWEATIGRIAVQSHPAQKVWETPILTNQKLGMLCAHHPRCGGRIHRRIMVQASLGKNQDLILKMTQAKKVSGMAQVVQCLPCKGETLSSNPSMAEKKKEHRKEAFNCCPWRHLPVKFTLNYIWLLIPRTDRTLIASPQVSSTCCAVCA
jgi:hypothetical protein